MSYREPAWLTRRSAIALLGLGMGLCISRVLAPDTDVLQRIDGAPGVMDAVRARIKPGTVLVTTDLPATPDTRSGSNFVVIDSPGS